MKKLFFSLTSSIMVFFACSKDDEGTGKDPLIGLWKQDKIVSREFPDSPTSECEGLTTVDYKADGTYIEDIYWDAEADGTCDHLETRSGIWVNKGNNIYFRELDISKANSNNEFVFENNRNIFYYQYTSFDGEDVLRVYYKRIK